MQPIVVFGLGLTGQSCLSFLTESTSAPIYMTDSRVSLACLEGLQAQYPQITYLPPPWTDYPWLKDAQLIVSPGIELRQFPFQSSQNLIGDIDLFCQNSTVPIIGITGTNGKSTVTTMVGHIASQCGLSVAMGGNLGPPALNLLPTGKTDYTILELSSYQLDTAVSLPLHTAVCLNIAPDHLDRYENYSAYQASKHRIYRQAKHTVMNGDDRDSHPQHGTESVVFSLEDKHADCTMTDGQLIWQGKALLAVKQLPQSYKHFVMNAMAAISISSTMGIAPLHAADALIGYQPLVHRCQHVATVLGVKWVNDSKSTTVASTFAAINSHSEPTTLIIGGQPKQENYQILLEAAQDLKQLIVYGQLRDVISSLLEEREYAVSCKFVKDVRSAVSEASRLTTSGQTVLFSPACPSYDQYDNFAARGEHFIQLIQKIKDETNKAKNTA